MKSIIFTLLLFISSAFSYSEWEGRSFLHLNILAVQDYGIDLGFSGGLLKEGVSVGGGIILHSFEGEEYVDNKLYTTNLKGVSVMGLFPIGVVPSFYITPMVGISMLRVMVNNEEVSSNKGIFGGYLLFAPTSNPFSFSVGRFSNSGRWALNCSLGLSFP